MNNPLVSVIIPCYNAEKYVEEAVRSIMTQTYKNLEILVTNDCSTDNTLKILQSLAEEDSRIKVIENKENLKIVKSLNNMIDIAQGKYIARMDADDISLPERIEKQVKFMEENPEYGVCGTNAWIIDEEGKKIGKTFLPIKYDEILFYAKYICPFYHPTVLIKSNVLKKYKYLENIHYAEDYELWCRLIYKEKFIMHNLPDKLLQYRKNKNQITQKYRDVQIASVAKFFEEYKIFSESEFISFKKIICLQGIDCNSFDKTFIRKFFNTCIKSQCKKNVIKRIVAFLYKIKSNYLIIMLIRPEVFLCFFELLVLRVKKLYDKKL